MSTAPTARVRVPPIAKNGEIIEVKTLISHDMENGQRKDAEGKVIPRKILKHFEAQFNGKTVFSADWHPAVAANPYQSFFLKATQSGELTFAWTDDDGTITRASAKLTVA